MNGAPGVATDDSPALPDPASEASLPLKPSRRRGQRSPTPTQEEDSSGQAHVAQPVGEASKLQPEGETSDQPRPDTAPDILDELMEKVKAAWNLVCSAISLGKTLADNKRSRWKRQTMKMLS